MKIFIIILSYLIPAVLATIVLNLLEKHNFYNKLRDFDKSNNGKVYDIIKSLFVVFTFLSFIFSAIYALYSGLYIYNILLAGNFYKAILVSLLTVITDCILFYGFDKF